MIDEAGETPAVLKKVSYRGANRRATTAGASPTFGYAPIGERR